ncbi:proteasome-domain-containing protein [Ascobolus immersus RN42]|uniref:Proteasome subunit beta n=1 Tax=Ascobolus immersus RN42 TaxID=1160509 RepID=A0A3N4IPL1_ASCIM|nr:proteasome-domain-containing protein [Ascobolus immersus RN42]
MAHGIMDGTDGWGTGGCLSRLSDSGREVLLGITGKDFTIIAASKAAVRGITILKAEDDKTRALNQHTLMAYSGEAGDTVQFAEYIQANVALYGMRTNLTQELSPPAVANFVRNQLATSLRSRNAKHVNLLIGGFDPVKKTPHLYWMDYLAAKAEVPYAAHGYAAYYCLSILDKHHHPDIDLEKGKELLKMCIGELRHRMPIEFKGMRVKVVSAEGITELEEF